MTARRAADFSDMSHRASIICRWRNSESGLSAPINISVRTAATKQQYGLFRRKSQFQARGAQLYHVNIMAAMRDIAD